MLFPSSMEHLKETDLLKSIDEHFHLDYVSMGGIQNIELILALFRETHKIAKVNLKRAVHTYRLNDRSINCCMNEITNRK